MQMTRDEIEFLISQYIDGTANELDRARIEEILATDADARAMLSEYQRLVSIVKSSLPVPEIAWDSLSGRIANETAKLEMPVKHYRLRFATVSKFAALAAMVTIVVGVIVKSRPPITNVDVGPGRVAVNTAPVDVQISLPPAMAAGRVSDIQIGQPSGFASADFRSSEAIVSSPTSIWIASGEGSAQDTDPSLY
jgi:hypothetical protein